MKKYITATTVKSWFMQNDLVFGMSLLKMEPEDAGAAMVARYGINLEGLDPGDEEGLLERLNDISR